MGLLHATIGFILAGITMEVFWTSIANYIKNKNPKLTGHTYLWMFLIYAIVPFIYILILKYFTDTNIFLKGLIYMTCFYLLEFFSGLLIRKIIGISPWNYESHKIKIFGKKYKSHFKGLVCLEFAPVWYLCGIIGEYYFLFLIGL